METVQALKLVAILVAAYHSWKPPEETLRLYAGTVEQLDFEATFEVVKEIIESPAKFAPSVGEIVTKARARMEIAERDRRLAMPCKHTPGEVRYDPKGRKYVADENGDLQLREVPDEILNTGRRAS